MDISELLTTRQIAERQRISPDRVSQIAKEMKMKPAMVIGSSNLYSPEQYQLIKARNKKPGPKAPRKG